MRRSTVFKALAFVGILIASFLTLGASAPAHAIPLLHFLAPATLADHPVAAPALANVLVAEVSEVTAIARPAVLKPYSSSSTGVRYRSTRPTRTKPEPRHDPGNVQRIESLNFEKPATPPNRT